MDIGSKLKKHRIQHQLTQEAVAEKLHVSRGTISSWETGLTFPYIEKLIYLRELYELSLDQLLKEDPIIMETIVTERKKLKRYKGLKIIGTCLLGLFLVYNLYWFTMVYPRNAKLKDWTQTDSNNYLEKNGYTFQAHDLKYPMFLPNGNISVANYKCGLFWISIDGDKVFVSVNTSDPALKGAKDKEDFGMIRMKRNDLNSSEYESLGDGNGELTRQLVIKHSTEFNKTYEAIERVWKEING